MYIELFDYAELLYHYLLCLTQYCQQDISFYTQVLL